MELRHRSRWPGLSGLPGGSRTGLGIKRRDLIGTPIWHDLGWRWLTGSASDAGVPGGVVQIAQGKRHAGRAATRPTLGNERGRLWS